MDGVVSSIDALRVISDLNLNGVGKHNLANNTPFTFLDVNRDGYRSPIDVLSVIGSLNTDGVQEVENGGHRNFTDPDEPFAFIDYNADGRITDADTEAVIDYLMANGETDNDPFATYPNWLDGNLDGRITRTDAWGPEMWIRTYGYTEYPLPDSDNTFLDATELPGPYSVVHVENANGIEIASATVTAYGGDINWTTVEYATAEGSANNIERGYLRIDGTIVSETTARDGGYFTFDLGAGYGVGEGSMVDMQFLADVSGNLDDNASIRVELCALDGEVMLDGRPMDGWGIGHYDQPVVVLQPTGDLFVTERIVPSSQMLLGTEAGRALGINMRADGGEDADVYEIRYVSDSNSIDRINVYTLNPGEGNVLIGHATLGGCGSDVAVPGITYCAHFESEQLKVPTGETYTVYGVPVLKDDGSGGISGEGLRLSVPMDGVKVRGPISGNHYVLYDGGHNAGGTMIGSDNFEFGQPSQPIVGEQHYVVGSKITSVHEKSDVAEASMPLGWTDVLHLGFQTADHENFNNGPNVTEIVGIIPSFEAYNTRLSSRVYVYNPEDASILAYGQIYDSNGIAVDDTFVANGVYNVEFYNLWDNSINTTIPRDSSLDLVMAMSFHDTNVDPALPSSYQAYYENYNRHGQYFGLNESHFIARDHDAMVDIAVTSIDYLEELRLEGTLFQS